MKPAGLNKPWPPLNKHHVCSLLDAVMCISACRWRLSGGRPHIVRPPLYIYLNFFVLCSHVSWTLSHPICCLSVTLFIHISSNWEGGRWGWWCGCECECEWGPHYSVSFLHVTKWLVLIQDRRFLIRLLQILEYSKANDFVPFVHENLRHFILKEHTERKSKICPYVSEDIITDSHLNTSHMMY